MAILNENQRKKLQLIFGHPMLDLNARKKMHSEMAAKGYSDSQISSVDPSYAMGDVPKVSGREERMPPEEPIPSLPGVSQPPRIFPEEPGRPDEAAPGVVSMGGPVKDAFTGFASGLARSTGLGSFTGPPGEETEGKRIAATAGEVVGTAAQAYGGVKAVSLGLRFLRTGFVLRNLRRKGAEIMDAFRQFRGVPTVTSATKPGGWTRSQLGGRPGATGAKTGTLPQGTRATGTKPETPSKGTWYPGMSTKPGAKRGPKTGTKSKKNPGTKAPSLQGKSNKRNKPNVI